MDLGTLFVLGPMRMAPFIYAPMQLSKGCVVDNTRMRLAAWCQIIGGVGIAESKSFSEQMWVTQGNSGAWNQMWSGHVCLMRSRTSWNQNLLSGSVPPLSIFKIPLLYLLRLPLFSQHAKQLPNCWSHLLIILSKPNSPFGSMSATFYSCGYILYY